MKPVGKSRAFLKKALTLFLLSGALGSCMTREEADSKRAGKVVNDSTVSDPESRKALGTGEGDKTHPENQSRLNPSDSAGLEKDSVRTRGNSRRK